MERRFRSFPIEKGEHHVLTGMNMLPWKPIARQGSGNWGVEDGFLQMLVTREDYLNGNTEN